MALINASPMFVMLWPTCLKTANLETMEPTVGVVCEVSVASQTPDLGLCLQLANHFRGGEERARTTVESVARNCHSREVWV